MPRLLPSAAAIFPHLQASVSVVRRGAAGIEVESRGSLAGIGAGPLFPTAAFWLFAFRTSSMTSAEMGHAQAVATPMNNLKQIGLAMHNYASTYGSLPPAYIADKATGKPLLSWRVAILPFLEQHAVYDQFHLDEPWDSPHNKPLIAAMPTTYGSLGSANAAGKTRFLTLRHKDSAFPGKDKIRLADITHGLSNTILAVEADEAHAVIWSKPDDLDFDPQKPTTGLNRAAHARGFFAAFCDGSVRFIQDSIDTEFLQDMANRHGKATPKR